MSRLTVGLLAGAAGLAVGLVVGYVVVKQACKDRIVSGVEGAVKSVGLGAGWQNLAGSLVRAATDST
ncbi:MAG TPA: hypothetical protein VES65_11460 [Solirubrobacteraceae bacterium]|nr:hypothetical protein [Solirubrobacteraceae bacterium]